MRTDQSIELALLIEQTIYGHEAHPTPSSFGLALADAILAKYKLLRKP